jgi:YVTN family beta-propeller protein
MWVLDLVGARVARTIPLGARRTPALRPGIALGAGGLTAYVSISQPSGQGFDTLQIVDTSSGAVTQRGLDFHPGALTVDRQGLLWIAGCTGLCADGTLRVIDPAGIGAIAKIPLPSVPGGLALTPGGERVLVANGLAGSVSVFDVTARSRIATIRVGAEPLGVAAAPGGRTAYVTSFAAGLLSAIDVATDAVVATARVAPSPRAVAVSADGRRAYVTHSTPLVSVVDLTRLRR